MQQNYANHRRFFPPYHYVTSLFVVAVLILSIINLIHVMDTPEWLYTGLMPLLVAITLVMLYWLCRHFAVKVQDRAIRAEVNFRHFLLTGKPLSPKLAMGQILALRFAGDEEYLTLMQRAIAENMKPDDIKKAIKDWRGDHDRC